MKLIKDYVSIAERSRIPNYYFKFKFLCTKQSMRLEAMRCLKKNVKVLSRG
jgi:hypothetical protein